MSQPFEHRDLPPEERAIRSLRDRGDRAGDLDRDGLRDKPGAAPNLHRWEDDGGQRERVR